MVTNQLLGAMKNNYTKLVMMGEYAVPGNQLSIQVECSKMCHLSQIGYEMLLRMRQIKEMHFVTK
jgi:hypothetical protein